MCRNEYILYISQYFFDLNENVFNGYACKKDVIQDVWCKKEIRYTRCVTFKFNLFSRNEFAIKI